MPEVGYENKPIRHDLKTVEGGWVELRRLPYDEILKRREMATRLSMADSPRRRKGHKVTRQEEQRIAIELAQVVTREYEFANCIVDHNLTVNGVPVDFSQPKLAFKIVSPEVLQEIELQLSELNMEADEDELEDFTHVASHSSSEDPMPVIGSEAS